MAAEATPATIRTVGSRSAGRRGDMLRRLSQRWNRNRERRTQGLGWGLQVQKVAKFGIPKVCSPLAWDSWV